MDQHDARIEVRNEIRGQDLGCIRTVPGHMQMSLVYCRRPDVDIVAKHDGVDVHPEHEVEIVFKRGPDHFDLQPSARTLPMVSMNDALFITMRLAECLHARDGDGCERLLNGIV